jgi:hypothetical protein
VPELPFIDEHARVVAAPAVDTWEALGRWTSRSSGGARSAAARALGCEQTVTAGPPGLAGSTIPGFRIAHSDPPAELALEGRHRFSRYQLTFRIEELAGGRSRLRAETRAEFPGLHGRAYRALVIGTRAHRRATSSLIQAIASRAERGRMGR